MRYVHDALKFLFVLFLWCLLVSFLTFLAPIAVIVFVIRGTESLIYHFKFNAITLRSDDLLYLMGKKENPMIISGVLCVDGILTVERLRILFQDLIKRDNSDGKRMYGRATKYVIPGFFNYYWVDDTDFDINRHVYELVRDVPIESDEELKDLIGNHCSKPLISEFKASPWEFVLIPYNETGVRKTVILFRLAHVIADGSSLAYFLVNGLAENTMSNVYVDRVKKFAEKNRNFITLKGLWYLPLAYLRVAFIFGDVNPLHTSKLSGQKCVTWSESIDLQVIKSAKNKLSTTVNDVLVGLLTHSLKNYIDDFLQSGENKKPMSFSAVFPVDTRSSISEAEYFDNRVAGIVLKLPISKEDVSESIRSTKLLFDSVKEHAEPIGMSIGWRFISFLLPACLSKCFVLVMLNKTTAIVSNVIGPDQKMYIDNHALEFLTFWPPQIAKETLGFSFCSYNGKISIGIESDTSVISQPHKIVSKLQNNLQNLLRICEHE